MRHKLNDLNEKLNKINRQVETNRSKEITQKT